MNLQRLKRSIPLAKKPNKEMKRRYGEAVEYGCILCKILYGVYTEPCIHHLTGGGMGMKSEDFIPLCHTHHQGSQGLHHLGNRVWEEKYGTQKEMLEMYLEETNNNKKE